MKVISIQVNDETFEAELNASKAAEAIWNALPIEAEGQLWGDEIYFNTGVEAEMELPRETVEKGDLGYWPAGKAFCIFYGETPVSAPGEIRPASAVEVIGKLKSDPEALTSITAPPFVKITRKER